MALSRRRLLASAGIGAAGVGLGAGGYLIGHDAAEADAAETTGSVPFYGEHQAGIATPSQDRLHFASFDLETESKAELRELMARTAGTLGGVLMLVTALALIFAPQLASVFSSGVDTDPIKQGLLVDLFRLTFPFLLFVSLTALAAGALNSFQRFGWPAFTPIILNLCMIAGALWGSKFTDPPILAMGWAILAAGVLQLLFQLPQLAKLDLLALPRGET